MNERMTTDQRIAWLEKNLQRSTSSITGTEYRIDIDGMARFRVFRNLTHSNEWVLVHHRPMASERMRELGFPFEIEGTRDRERFAQRRAALRWIAIRWDDVIDRAVAATR